MDTEPGFVNYSAEHVWWLLAAAIVLFPLDVGIRRVQLDREEWARAVAWLAARLGLPAETRNSLRRS